MFVCWGTGCIKCMEDSKMGLKGLGEKWGSIVDAIQELPAVITDGNKQWELKLCGWIAFLEMQES